MQTMQATPIAEQITVKNTKGKKDRIVIIFSKSLLEDLRNFNIDTITIFDIQYETIQYIFQKIKTELNLKLKFEPRIMRVSFAKYLWGKGIRRETIQFFLGHQSADTTNIYLDLTPEMILDDCKKLKEN